MLFQRFGSGSGFLLGSDPDPGFFLRVGPSSDFFGEGGIRVFLDVGIWDFPEGQAWIGFYLEDMSRIQGLFFARVRSGSEQSQPVSETFAIAYSAIKGIFLLFICISNSMSNRFLAVFPIISYFQIIVEKTIS